MANRRRPCASDESTLAAWIYWAESRPEAEREWRIQLKARLEAIFPEAMTPPLGVYGWRTHQESGDARLAVVLVHGLDEPGDIWEDVTAALAELPVGVIEFRYPNDQAVDASADFLAQEWAELASARAVIFIAHSMDELVQRAPSEDLAAAFATWGADIRAATGDGVVTVESVALADFPPPVVLTASHRGLIRRSPLETGTPPALPILLD